ncbi:DNA-binding response regulator [Rhodobacteraceae bacterium WD3A24]|nr:DNA-binding response regulator [Rhodobacteraceae bacterium WD3A24]
MAPTPHILVVDDHREIREAVTRYLERNGMRATAACDAAEMDARLAAGRFDLIVLDVMMPGESGLDACRRLAAGENPPVILLTALGEDDDRIAGLEIGADDYLAKPFNPRELLARIRTVLRRAHRQEPARLSGRHLEFAGRVLDTDRRILLGADDAETTLTTSEFRLLMAFLERPRLVLNRDDLLEITTGRRAALFDRTIDNQVSRLRRKVEREPGHPELITTVRGGGYCLSADVREVS